MHFISSLRVEQALIFIEAVPTPSETALKMVRAYTDRVCDSVEGRGRVEAPLDIS
jgi:hypothetical protein